MVDSHRSHRGNLVPGGGGGGGGQLRGLHGA